jgi:hypothetical protein
MNIPKTMDSIPVLGYLVATRIGKTAVKIADYNEVVALATANHSAKLAALAANSSRSMKDVLANALKEFVETYSDGHLGFRYITRKDRDGSMHIIRELAGAADVSPDADPKYTAFTYGDIGSITTSGNELVTRPAYVGNRADDVRPVFDEIANLVEQYKDMFPSSGIKFKLNTLMKDTVPLGYDPEHIFSFILAEHADVLAGVADVIDFLKRSGGTSSMSILPLPDMAEVRTHMVDKCVEEVAAAVDRVKGRMGEVQKDRRIAENALETLRNASELACTYRQRFGAAVETLDAQLDSLRVHLANLIGGATVRERTLPVGSDAEVTNYVQHIARALYEEGMPAAVSEAFQDAPPSIVPVLVSVGRSDDVHKLRFNVVTHGSVEKAVDVLTLKADERFGSYTVVFNGEMPCPGELPSESSLVGKLIRVRVDKDNGPFNHPALGLIGNYMRRWFDKWVATKPLD